MLQVKANGRTKGFTLIELLVVVAVIAMLISILLPSLSRARESARAAVCGTGLRDIGIGMSTYMTEYGGWFPGVNTTGVAARVAGVSSPEALRKPGVPIQTYDWISPSIRHSTDLGDNRAKRLQSILKYYSCPSQASLKIDLPWGLQDALDRDDFGNPSDPDSIVANLAPVSYLMPIHFQTWGQAYSGTTIAISQSATGRPVRVLADCPPNYISAKHTGHYQSRIEKVGSPARKIAGADGLRYLRDDDLIDMDLAPHGTWSSHVFGCFASNGAWWGGSQAYGVKTASLNWDGTPVPEGSESQGRNLSLSYRHGAGAQGTLSNTAPGNPGEMNAMFFDGHVARLNDRASREIEYWYPSGTTVNGGGGLLDYEDGYEVP